MSLMEEMILCASGRLTVRRLRESDFEALYALLSDPSMMEYLEPPYTREQTKAFLREAGLASTPLIYGIEDRKGKFIGYVIYHSYDRDSVELGWVLKPEEWHKGYACELTRMLLERAGGTYAYAVIECVPEQEVTKHIALKNGFQLVGIENGCEIYRWALDEDREQNSLACMRKEK